MIEGDFIQLHAHYEQEHPDDARYAHSLAIAREENGLAAGRDFPCPGTIRVDEENAHHILAGCDVCAFCYAIPRLTTHTATTAERSPF